MPVFRHSTIRDIDAMMEVIDSGKELLKGMGIDQWQKGYPNRELLVSDVEAGIGYVIEDADRVVGVCAVTFTDEESYRGLRNGAWLTPEGSVNAAIHRGAIAKDSRGQGLTSFLFSAVEDMARKQGAVSMRADTHPENSGMRRSLEKAGFVRCGEIVLSDGAEAGDMRVAYEKAW